MRSLAPWPKTPSHKEDGKKGRRGKGTHGEEDKEIRKGTTGEVEVFALPTNLLIFPNFFNLPEKNIEFILRKFGSCSMPW